MSDRSELELLSFRIGEQEYSVDIMSVREIRGWTRPTPLPHSASYVRGVINLRGTVLPIVDSGGEVKGILHLHDILGKGEFKFNGA